MCEARHFKFGMHIGADMTDYPKGDVSGTGSCDLCKFLEITDNFLETIHDRDIVAMED